MVATQVGNFSEKDLTGELPSASGHLGCQGSGQHPSLSPSWWVFLDQAPSPLLPPGDVI